MVEEQNGQVSTTKDHTRSKRYASHYTDSASLSGTTNETIYLAQASTSLASAALRNAARSAVSFASASFHC